MKTNIFVLIGLLLAALMFSSCKEGITSHNIDLDGVEHGKKLYQGAKDCTACHGIALKGNGWIPGCYDCHGVMWNKDDHLKERGGVMHKRGFQATENCGSCHGGDALTGKRSRPSCFSCHGDNWSDLAFHNVTKSGIQHGTNLFEPSKYCAGCHGSALDGEGNAPGCYSCHYDKWSAKVPHTTMLYGYGHAEAYNSPQNNCSECHGSDLRGSKAAPSCYSCHGQKW
ncbi:MAG: hypothetical protein RRB13_07410 [bacterium]|nr:hypothetical protein [bacterium]